MKFFAAVLGSLWMLIALCNHPHAAEKNVVLIVADDHGLDAGCYGNPVLKTPNLDRLSVEGTRFTHAFCTTASCSASRSVILTGLHNHANGQYGHEHSYHHFRAHDQVKSLPRLMRQAGYRTARAGKFHVGPVEVFPFDEVLPDAGRNPVRLAENCRAFLTKADRRPFFLYFATHDPHRSGDVAPGSLRPNAFGNRPAGFPGIETRSYAPALVKVPPFLPDTPTCRAELAEYYQSVSRNDQGLGRLIQILKETGHYDDTLIIYISDNGIAFPGAKTTLYEPGMRLPCVVRHPRASRRGLVSSAMISWVDLAPTVLDFAGARPDQNAAMHGRSFLGELERESSPGWDEVHASHTFHEVTMYYPMRVVRTRTHKLIWNIAHPLPFPFASDLWAASTFQDVYRQGLDALYGKRTVRAYIHRPAFELYDLEKDPDEIHNLAPIPAHAALFNQLKADLRVFQKRTGDPWELKWHYE